MSVVFARSFALVALFVATHFALPTAMAGEPRPTIAVLDAPDDAVDGPEFAMTLDAYLAPIDVRSIVVPIPTSPPSHADWLAVAQAEGTSRGALAVLWFEPNTEDTDAIDVYLVLLDRDSGGVVVLPVALGAREGRAAYRVLAATARMILDTEVIERLRESARIQKRETTPEPWPRPAIAVPIPGSASPEPRRTVDLGVGYLGEYRTSDHQTLHGARLDMTLRLARGFGVALDVGSLTRPEDRVADVAYREQRAPFRLGVAFLRPIGRFELAAGATWLAEPVWIRGEAMGEEKVKIEATPRLDTGGGVDLGAGVRLRRGLGVFAGIGVTLMAVSYRYERYGEPGFTAGLVRLSWTVGLDWRGL
jgi:hypothetical protein